MFNTTIDEVKARFKKSAIMAAIFSIVLFGIGVSQQGLDSFLELGIQAPFLLYAMMGGIWYGRYVIAAIWRPVYDEVNGIYYYPGGFVGHMVCISFGIAIGMTVGAIFFAIDGLRLIVDKIRNRGRNYQEDMMENAYNE